MADDYIPKREGELAQVAAQVARLLAQNPGKFGLAAGDADHFRALVDDYAAALARARDPATRAATAVADKDAKRLRMVAAWRFWAQTIRGNWAVSNEDKLSLGLRLVHTTWKPVPAPTTQPLLRVIGATPRQHTVRFADAATPAKRALPPGARALVLFCYVGDAPPRDPAQARFTAMTARQPCVVTHKAHDIGKTAYYFARWTTQTGKLGPWSSAASMTIAA